jgi:hypothetical protein
MTAFAVVGCLAIAGTAAAQIGASRPVTIPPAQILPPGADGSAEQAPTLTMRALLPTSVRVLRDSRGAGLVMYGALNGKAASAIAVLQGIFTYSQAFDPIPALPLVLADEDDRHAEALFTATAHGTPVTGIAAVSLSDSGGAVRVFYDHTASFTGSFPRLRQALADGTAATVVLTPLQLPDGSQISMPPGWRVIGAGAGLVDLMGTQGEFVSLGAASQVRNGPATAGGTMLQGPCCEPVAALKAVYPQLNANAQHLGSPAQLLTEIVEAQPADPGDGTQAAFVLSRLAVGGRPYSYFALVRTIAGFADEWTLRLSGFTAPQPVFATEFPTLLQIWRSHSANPPQFGVKLKQALQNLPATRQILHTAGGTPRPGDYGASAAWGGILTALPAKGPPAVDEDAARQLTDRLSQDSGKSWHIVPPSELK